MFKDSTCRDEIISSVREIISSKGKNEFTISEVIHHMKNKGTKYKESTIRTHISSRCCSNRLRHYHAVCYDDFENIGKGKYKLLLA
jgi:hypothetical protein